MADLNPAKRDVGLDACPWLCGVDEPRYERRGVAYALKHHSQSEHPPARLTGEDQIVRGPGYDKYRPSSVRFV